MVNPDPNLSKDRNALGLAALEVGEAIEAIEHFGAAVAADPSATDLWMNLAKRIVWPELTQPSA